MKEIGITIKLKEKGHSGMQKGIFMSEISKQIKLTGLEYIHMLTEVDMMASGLMTYRKEKAKKSGLTEPNTWANILMV